MDLNHIVAVSMIWGVAAITPGPNFFITVHTAIGTTRYLSLFTVFGIVAGTLVWSISGYMGISILFKTVPILYFTLKILGGLYLIYVGLNLIFKRKNQFHPNNSRNHSAISCFRLGLLTNLLNPKTAAFITSLFAATIPPESTLQLGAFYVLLICFISASWYSLVALVFSYDISKKFYEHQKRKIEKIAGAIFIGFGIKLSISK